MNIGTAGSISLLLQALILPCLFASNKVTLNIIGGTCGKGQAPVDYLQNVFLPQLERFAKIELKIWKRGYYPKGGGRVTVEISPRWKLKEYDNFEAFAEELSSKIYPITIMKRGTLEQIRGVVNCSAALQEKEVAERVKSAAENSLKELGVPISIRVDYAQSASIGGEIVLWAIFGAADENPVRVGSDALMDERKSSEQVGAEAAAKLKEEMKAGFAVDRHLADQLIPLMGLLPSSAIYSGDITKHVETNMYVVEQFLPVLFKVEKQTIRVEQKDL